MLTIERTSELAAPAPDVWRHATSLAGINHELAPYLMMTAPPELREVALDAIQVALGEPLFASRALLFGIVPVERMQVTLVELEPGRRFVEQSALLALPYWRHERTVDAVGTGCRLRDALAFRAPVAIAAPVLHRLLIALFTHRHRRLRALFGAQ